MALMMMIIFLAVAVVARTILQYRLTGDHGLHSGFTGASAIEKLSTLLLLLVLLCALYLSILDFQDTLPVLFQSFWSTVAGVTICLLGISITCLSQYQMGKEWRIGVDAGERTELITRGLYSKVRNPIYSGVIVFGTGLFVLLPSAAMLIVLLLGFVSIDLHVRYVEEPYLTKLHGKVYRQYVMRTGRYFP